MDPGGPAGQRAWELVRFREARWGGAWFQTSPAVRAGCSGANKNTSHSSLTAWPAQSQVCVCARAWSRPESPAPPALGCSLDPFCGPALSSDPVPQLEKLPSLFPYLSGGLCSLLDGPLAVPSDRSVCERVITGSGSCWRRPRPRARVACLCAVRTVSHKSPVCPFLPWPPMRL